MAPLVLSTLVIVALQCSRKVSVFFWPTDCISLDFFQGVWRGWPFLSFWPIIFFLFPPGGDSRYSYLLFLAFFFSGTVNAGRYQISKYIYIYIHIVWKKKRRWQYEWDSFQKLSLDLLQNRQSWYLLWGK